MVGVAHLARAPGCGPGGGGFDPLRSPHKHKRRCMASPFVFIKVREEVPTLHASKASSGSTALGRVDSNACVALGSIPFVADFQYTLREKHLRDAMHLLFVFIKVREEVPTLHASKASSGSTARTPSASTATLVLNLGFNSRIQY